MIILGLVDFAEWFKWLNGWLALGFVYTISFRVRFILPALAVIHTFTIDVICAYRVWRQRDMKTKS